jgi:hypothetical protein
VALDSTQESNPFLSAAERFKAVQRNPAALLSQSREITAISRISAIKSDRRKHPTNRRWHALQLFSPEGIRAVRFHFYAMQQLVHAAMTVLSC